MRGDPPKGTHYTEHLRTLVDGPYQQRRRAVTALIADTANRHTILDSLTRTIEERSAILYGPTPDGVKPREREKYEAMNRAACIEQAAIQTALGILGPDGLLDNEQLVRLVDRSGMLERLGRWQDHVVTMKRRALETAQGFRKKHGETTIKDVAIFGLGGSGAPHDIAAAIISNSRRSSVRIEVIHADTPNPDYIDRNTLAIFSSFSGDTEETIECYRTVQHKTDMKVVLTKGGRLGDLAREQGIPYIQLPAEKEHPAYVMQPRESVCLQLTAALTFLASVGLPPGAEGSLVLETLAFENRIIPSIREWGKRFGPKVPYRENPAKQLAFFLLYGVDYRGEGNIGGYDLWQKKIPCVLADRNNWAIGHECRTQLHERSKVNAIFYEAPEFLHNLVESIRAGIGSSQGGLDENPFVYYFIRSLDEEPRIRLRLDKTIALIIEGKGCHASLNAQGESPFERALSSLYFNAYTATYLAILNGFDPLPVPTMSWIKNVMHGFERNGKEEEEAQTTQRPQVTFGCPPSKSTACDHEV